MSWLNLNEELLSQVEEQTVATSSTIESGVYEVKINQAFVRKTDSGATMFELEAETKNGQKVFWNTCVKSGDAKGNKATYTDKNGKEKLLPGVTHTIHLFEAVGLDLTKEEPTSTIVEHKGAGIDAGVFKAMTGKQFKACVRQYESEYNGDISIRYDIETFLDLDGKNKKGEELESKFLAKIEKSPIKLLKKAKTATPSADTQAAAAASGW